MANNHVGSYELVSQENLSITGARSRYSFQYVSNSEYYKDHSRNASYCKMGSVSDLPSENGSLVPAADAGTGKSALIW